MDNRDVLDSPIIKKFNWGAFSDPIFWGIGNKTYITLLALVPFLNIVWMFVCGFKGNEWAWQNGNYSSLEEFEKVQATWNRAGVVRFIFNIIGIIVVCLMTMGFIAAAAETGYNSYMY